MLTGPRQEDGEAGGLSILPPVCNLKSVVCLQAPSGSRTHTSAMARQQATATSWAQNCITTKLSKIEAGRRL